MKKFSLIDGLIIAVLAVILIAGVHTLRKASGGSRSNNQQESSKLVFTVEDSKSEQEMTDLIQVGDVVGIGVNQTDTCVVTKVVCEPASEYVFDSLTGTYKQADIPERYNVKVTCEGEASVTDMKISIGNTAVRVGTLFSLTGKGYKLTGYVIESDLVR